MLFKNNKAQSTAEYAILIGVVVGALIAMQVYVRRSLQAKTKTIVDLPGSLMDIVPANTTFSTQYEPYYSAPISGTTTQDVGGSSYEGLTTGGGATRGVTDQSTTMGGDQVVGGTTDMWRE